VDTPTLFVARRDDGSPYLVGFFSLLRDLSPSDRASVARDVVDTLALLDVPVPVSCWS
jgi:hypothetical protein